MRPAWFAYTAPGLAFDPTRRFRQGRGTRNFGIGKPHGFWFTDDSGDNWPNWCVRENFRLEDLRCEHAVDVDLSECIRLGSALDIDDFTARFACRLHPDIDLMLIDWERVARRWRGIVIAPYVWERRLSEHCFWYYGWDCASGCVWDLDAIRSVELIADSFDVAALREAQRVSELDAIEAVERAAGRMLSSPRP